MCISLSNRRFAAALAITACTLLTQSACTPKSVKTGPPGNSAAVDSLLAELAACKTLRRDLDEKNASLLELTAHLQKYEEASRTMQAELDRTHEVLEYAERQFISLEKGLQSHETKASAVSSLAEARLAYDKVLRDDPRTAQQPNVREALLKLERSDTMILKRRYAASVYFASRAMRLLEDRVDATLVRIIAVDQANVRIGPGLQYEVVARVDIGTILVELENKSPWFRVETRTGLAGWVHESVTALR